jgi:hypothetical protein
MPSEQRKNDYRDIMTNSKSQKNLTCVLSALLLNRMLHIKKIMCESLQSEEIMGEKSE